MILDIRCNSSDHHPIIWTLQSSHCSIGVNDGSHSSHVNKRLYKQHCDKADLMLYYNITGARLRPKTSVI